MISCTRSKSWESLVAKKKNVARVLAASALIVCSGVTIWADDALSFFDALTTESHGPYLSIPFDYYGYTSSGLRRNYSASGTFNGTDRPLVKTVSGAFLTRNWTYTLTAASNVSSDLIFIGFGEGLTNGSFFNEPTNSILFRIHCGLAGNRVDVAATKDVTASPFTYLETIGTYDCAGTTFRIERNGDNLTLSIDDPNQPLSTRTLSLSQYAPYLNDTNGYLFFGNSAEGTTFSDFSVVSEPLVIDQDGDGVADDADSCLNTAPDATVNAVGCSIEQLCPCQAQWRNHGRYVSCVAQQAGDFRQMGLITEEELDAIVSNAGQSACGK